jgi:Flp pilus assembly protein protease CpaA
MVSWLPVVLVAPWIIMSDVRRHCIPNKAQAILLLLTELTLAEGSGTLFMSANVFGLLTLIGGILVRSLSKSAVGMGDVKLIAILAVGMGDIEKLVSSLLIASFVGLIWFLVARTKVIPFAPALIAGSLLTHFLSL